MDKFRGYKKFQRFINQAPKQVLQAYQAGWSNIKHHSENFDIPCCGGSCGSVYTAGWYGTSPEGKRELICGNNGEKIENLTVSLW